MRNTFLAALLAACLLSACGGGGDSEPAPVAAPPGQSAAKSLIARLIAFGDITGLHPKLTGQIWIEQVAKRLKLSLQCATSLDGDKKIGVSVFVAAHARCFADAQGGVPVTAPVVPKPEQTGSRLGASTAAVAAQIARHLALSGGKFQPDDLVLVTAGGDDLLREVEAFAATVVAAEKAAGQKVLDQTLAAALSLGAKDPAAALVAIRAAMAAERAKPGSTDDSVTKAGIAAAAGLPGNAAVAQLPVQESMVKQAITAARAAAAAAGKQFAADNAPKLKDAMTTAGAELVALVKNQILANGAQHVVVNSLPDLALTPTGLAMNEETRALVSEMAQVFYTQLLAGLANNAEVLVDNYRTTQPQWFTMEPKDRLELACDTYIGMTGVLRDSFLCDPSRLETYPDGRYPMAYFYEGLTDLVKNYCARELSPQNPLRDSFVCNPPSLEADADGEYAMPPRFYEVLTDRIMEEIKKKGWSD